MGVLVGLGGWRLEGVEGVLREDSPEAETEGDASLVT